jgi:phage FluMu protein Com
LSSNKKLGIFVCTRNRIEGLSSLLDSIFSKCKDVDNLDVWVGFDHDDEATQSFIQSTQHPLNYYINHSKSATCVGCNEEYVNRHKDVIQPMVDSSQADYHWVLNDDIVIETDAFDFIIEQSIESFLQDKSDRIFYGMPNIFFVDNNGITCSEFIEDVFNKKTFATEYSCYPLLTKETSDAIGYFLPTEFATNTADIALGSGIGLSNYNRKFKLPVVIKDKIQQQSKHAHMQLSDIHNAHNVPFEICAKLNEFAGDIFESEAVSPINIGIFQTFTCNNCGHSYNEPSYFEKMITTCPNCKKVSFVSLGDELTRAKLYDAYHQFRFQLRALRGLIE